MIANANDNDYYLETQGDEAVLRNDLLIMVTLLLSLGLHLGLVWYQSAAPKQNFQAPSGHSMAVTLGAPPEIKKEIIKPKEINELITTTALDAKTQYTPEKPEPEIEEVIKDLDGELEELIVTREVKLSQQPIPPIYPEKARREQQQGLVLVRAQVDEKGKTHQVLVSQSSGFPLLDKAAIEAVSQWSFLPAQENDQKITAWIEVPIDFKLR